LCGVKYSTAALLSISIASYCSIKRLALKYFSYTQQAHKLNETGINQTTVFDKRTLKRKIMKHKLISRALAVLLFLFAAHRMWSLTLSSVKRNQY